MQIIAWGAFAAAIACGVLRFTVGGYIYSALISGLCGMSVLFAGGGKGRLLLAAGLFVSVVADWFLNHQSGHSERFLYGVIGFFVAHCLFVAYAALRYSFSPAALIAAAVLLIGFGAYMLFRALPNIEAGLKLPITAYMLVSMLSLYAAFSMSAPVAEKVLYIVGIAAIVFSDTMIAENIFLGVKPAAKLVHPTYFACHWLITLSALLRR